MNKKKILSLALLATLLPQLGMMAQSNSSNTQQLTEISVHAQPTKVYSDHLRVVMSIDKSTIAQMPVQTVQELLNNLPGLDVRQRGGSGVQADISMRGGTFDQVLILLNGVAISDPQTGHHTLNLPIDLNMVERVEILQGGAISLFGTNALSGAINIVTNEKADDALKVSLTGGSFGLFNPSVASTFASNKWRWAISASHNESAGYTENTDYRYTQGFVQAQFQATEQDTWKWQIGVQDKAFGANSFYSVNYPNQFEKTKTLISSISWDKRINSLLWQSTAYYRGHFDQFELFRNYENAASWYTFHNYHLSHVSGINSRLSWFTSLGKSSIGIEGRNEHINSNVLGELKATPQAIPFAKNTNTQFLYEKNRTNVQYFAEQTIYLQAFTASVGVSGNYNTQFGNRYSYGLNTSYAFNTYSQVFANINKSLRLPTFTDLYYKSATQESNPNLKPEEAITAEIGAKYTKQAWQWNANAFYRIANNSIDWVRSLETEKWKSMNHTRIDAMGGEIAASYTGGFWAKNIQASYAYVLLNKDAGDMISKYALDYLQHKINLQYVHGISKQVDASWVVSYQDRKGNYVNKDGNKVAYTPFATIDTRINWQQNNTKMYAEISNILNQHYYDYGGVPIAGRMLKIGIAVQL